MNILEEIEQHNNEGNCISLIYDDNGGYAFVTDGMQNIRDDGQDLSIHHFVEAKYFKPTIAEAWEIFIAECL